MSNSSFFVFILATPKSCTAGFHVGVSPDVSRSVAVREMSDHASRLVYIERFDAAADACRRERQIRSWRVSRKIALIEARNPAWLELAAPAA